MTIKVLGLESSCDDSGAAIVSSDHHILANIIISQNNAHQAFNGVVPEIAARYHLQNLEYAIRQALQEAKMELNNVDAIAATTGPGLIGGVIVGTMFGKTIATVLNKPFIAVNHLEGHALTARLTDSVPYPYLLLLISGGHCQFVAVKSLGDYLILGQTLDDAAGEAFDKVAKMLGLPFPGGPEIEKKAKFGDRKKYTLPKPICNQPDCNMSFSGLKTAVRNLITELGKLNEQKINDIAASFEYTVGEVLTTKIVQAIKKYEKICAGKTIVVAGGVAANLYLKNALTDKAKKFGYQLIAPPVKLCTDNAAMIAWAGIERFQAGLTNGINTAPRARWSLEDCTNFPL